MNVHAIRAIYPFRDGAHLPHAPAEHRHAGDLHSLYFVVFGSAIGNRIRRSTACPTALSSCPG
jgi:hypothetical protein